MLLAMTLQPAIAGEVYGFLGRSWNGDDEGSIGAGLTGGGSLGWRPTQRFAVEAEVEHFRHSRELPAAAVRGEGTFVTGNALYHFARGRMQPFLLAGLGMAHYALTSDFSGAPGRSGNGVAVTVGVGFKSFLTPRLAVRPEIRLSGANIERTIEPPLVHLRLSVGLGYWF